MNGYGVSQMRHPLFEMQIRDRRLPWGVYLCSRTITLYRSSQRIIRQARQSVVMRKRS